MRNASFGLWSVLNLGPKNAEESCLFGVDKRIEHEILAIILGIIINHYFSDVVLTKKLWIRTRVFCLWWLNWDGNKSWESVGDLPCELVCCMNCRPVPPPKKGWRMMDGTPPKTNMTMAKQQFEHVSPIKNCCFSIVKLVLGGVL